MDFLDSFDGLLNREADRLNRSAVRDSRRVVIGFSFPRWTNQRPRVEPVPDLPSANQPRTQPNSPPRSSGTSSLASNHVRHRPHLQARRAHRAQGLGTRPARIDREPRPRPARLGNAPSIDRSLDWIDAPKPPARRVRRVSRGGREKRGDRPRLLDRTFNIVAVGRGGPHGTVRAPERPPSARARRFFIRISQPNIPCGDAHNLPKEG